MFAAQNSQLDKFVWIFNPTFTRFGPHANSGAQLPRHNVLHTASIIRCKDLSQSRGQSVFLFPLRSEAHWPEHGLNSTTRRNPKLGLVREIKKRADLRLAKITAAERCSGEESAVPETPTPRKREATQRNTSFALGAVAKWEGRGGEERRSCPESSVFAFSLSGWSKALSCPAV